MTDKQQIENGAKIIFGAGALSKPTPMFMKYIFRTFAFLSGVWAILPQDLVGMADADLLLTNRWLMVGNTIILFTIKFFGWKNGN